MGLTRNAPGIRTTVTRGHGVAQRRHEGAQRIVNKEQEIMSDERECSRYKEERNTVGWLIN